MQQGPRTTDHGQRTAFTLVELLVVITIIGILAALITVAAVGALKKAQETRIKSEVNEISTAFEEYKNKVTAYPPNCQTDGGTGPLNETQIFQDLKRHLKQISPRNNEPDELLQRLAGVAANSPLPGGMSAGEAVVFWLGGFSSDPKFPISGEGGPSYLASEGNRDPIESRKWIYPFEVTRLGPRNSDNYFDDSAGRFITYNVIIPGQNNNQPQLRRINLWQYTPAKSTQPYLYFDTSRHAPTADFDPPASADLHVHAFKKRADSPTLAQPIQYVDPNKFQLLHAGIDDAWGEEAFERMSPHAVSNAEDYLLFPTGPFSGEVADTIVNFTTQTRLEDAQP